MGSTITCYNKAQTTPNTGQNPMDVLATYNMDSK